MARYLLRFTNVFGRDFFAASIDEAIAIAKRNCFETTVIDQSTGSVVGCWSPIGGWRRL